jgi:hypothetical protein
VREQQRRPVPHQRARPQLQPPVPPVWVLHMYNHAYICMRVSLKINYVLT